MKYCKCIISGVVIEKENKFIKVEGIGDFGINEKQWNLFVDEVALTKEKDSAAIPAFLIDKDEIFKIDQALLNYAMDAYYGKKPVLVFINDGDKRRKNAGNGKWIYEVKKLEFFME